VAINDLSRWTLDEALAATSLEAQRFLSDLYDQRPRLPSIEIPRPAPFSAPAPPGVASLDALGLLAWTIKMVLADGMVDAREQQMLARAAARRGVSDDRVKAMMESAARGELEVVEPSGHEQARAWLGAMATMAMADGRIDKSETALLASTGQRYGLTAYDVNQLIKQSRNALYASAKQQLRDARREQRTPGADGGYTRSHASAGIQ
jgi:uncharacterized tellurite resistance protein B-like protein